MSRIVFSLIILSISFVLGALCFPESSMAQYEASPYEITGVSVDVSDESSVKARNKAFIEAQAFVQLAEKFGHKGQRPSQEMLASLVQDFEIEKEQLSSKRYRGSFTIRFNEQAVNSYFGSNLGHGVYSQSTVSYAQENNGRKALILPFMQMGKENILWQKDRNYFWLALQNDPIFSAGAYELPTGTISDSTDVWEKDPNLISMSSIRKIEERYGVGEVIVITMRESSAGRGNFLLDMYRTDQSRVELVKTIPFSGALTSTDQTVYTKAALILNQALQSEWKPVEERYGDFAHEEPQTTINQRVESAEQVPSMTQTPYQGGLSYSTTPEQNKSPAAATFTKEKKHVVASYGTIMEWAALQRTLKSSKSISSYNVESVKVREASLSISYADWPAVMKDLATSGYRVEMNQDGSVRLSRQGQ